MGLITPFFNAFLIILQVIQWIVLVWVIISWLLFFAALTSFRWRFQQESVILNQLTDLFTRMTSPFLLPFSRLVPPPIMGVFARPPLLLLHLSVIRSGVVP